MATEPAGWCDPLPGGRFISGWGAPRDGGARSHKGNDLAAPTGTPIMAAAAGTVLRAGQSTSITCGLRVAIDHGGGFETIYCHLDSVTVSAGQQIGCGQQIGTVGFTGNAIESNPHVHFEIHVDGVAVDPARYDYRGGGGGGDVTTPVPGDPADAFQCPGDLTPAEILAYSDDDLTILDSSANPCDMSNLTQEQIDALQERVDRFIEGLDDVPIVSDVTAGLAAIAAAISAFVDFVTDSENWIRVAAFAGGSILVIIGARGLLRANLPGAPGV